MVNLVTLPGQHLLLVRIQMRQLESQRRNPQLSQIQTQVCVSAFGPFPPEVRGGPHQSWGLEPATPGGEDEAEGP